MDANNLEVKPDEVYIPSLEDLVHDLDDRLLPEGVMAFLHYKDEKEREKNKKTWVHLDELKQLSVLNKVHDIFHPRLPGITKRMPDKYV